MVRSRMEFVLPCPSLLLWLWTILLLPLVYYDLSVCQSVLTMKSVSDSTIVVESNSLPGNSKPSKVFQDSLFKVTLLGVDISHLTQTTQFALVSFGVFVFFVLYGFLLVSIILYRLCMICRGMIYCSFLSRKLYLCNQHSSLMGSM